VLQAVTHRLSGFQWEAILGGLMGMARYRRLLADMGRGTGSDIARSRPSTPIWKASLLDNIGKSRSTGLRMPCSTTSHRCLSSPSFRHAVYIGGKKVFSGRLSEAANAFVGWPFGYMTTVVSLCEQRGFRLELETERPLGYLRRSDGADHARTARFVSDRYLGHHAEADQSRRNATFVFAKDETAKLHALIAPFIHPSMDYKLLPRYRGRFSVEPVFAPDRRELVPMPIVSVAPKPQTRSMHRFDIEVEGSHNYFVDGVMVHNSPETTPVVGL